MIAKLWCLIKRRHRLKPLWKGYRLNYIDLSKCKICGYYCKRDYRTGKIYPLNERELLDAKAQE